MNRDNLEVVVNTCWRIIQNNAPDFEIMDFIESLNNEIPEFSFKHDMCNRIIVIQL